MTTDLAELVANARRDISDADRCLSLHITPAAGTLHRRLREVTDALAALSTPPADDVREALAAAARDSVDRLLGWKHLRMYGGMSPEWMDKVRDAIISGVADALEVRPRGTVAAEAREAEMRELHHFEVEQQLAETIAIVKRAQAAVLKHEHTPASLHMDHILNEVNTDIPSASQVRSREMVTDAEVTAALRAYDGGSASWGHTHSSRMRSALEAAREIRS